MLFVMHVAEVRTLWCKALHKCKAREDPSPQKSKQKTKDNKQRWTEIGEDKEVVDAVCQLQPSRPHTAVYGEYCCSSKISSCAARLWAMEPLPVLTAASKITPQVLEVP